MSITRLHSLTQLMFGFFSGDPKRIQHFLKVHAFARLIGIEEGLSGEALELLEAAALVHDIGIRPAEARYGRCSGKLQEQEGPLPASRLLRQVGYPEAVIERVCWLVAHHHTYGNIQALDHQILVEADFLVNLYEDGSSREAMLSTREKIFKTRAGLRLITVVFGLPAGVSGEGHD